MVEKTLPAELSRWTGLPWGKAWKTAGALRCPRETSPAFLADLLL